LSSVRLRSRWGLWGSVRGGLSQGERCLPRTHPRGGSSPILALIVGRSPHKRFRAGEKRYRRNLEVVQSSRGYAGLLKRARPESALEGPSILRFRFRLWRRKPRMQRGSSFANQHDLRAWTDTIGRLISKRCLDARSRHIVWRNLNGVNDTTPAAGGQGRQLVGVFLPACVGDVSPDLHRRMCVCIASVHRSASYATVLNRATSS
jgi:hypothetical protein